MDLLRVLVCTFSLVGSPYSKFVPIIICRSISRSSLAGLEDGYIISRCSLVKPRYLPTAQSSFEVKHKCREDNAQSDKQRRTYTAGFESGKEANTGAQIQRSWPTMTEDMRSRRHACAPYAWVELICGIWHAHALVLPWFYAIRHAHDIAYQTPSFLACTLKKIGDEARI